jgi:hypothetical protein
LALRPRAEAAAIASASEAPASVRAASEAARAVRPAETAGAIAEAAALAAEAAAIGPPVGPRAESARRAAAELQPWERRWTRPGSRCS